MKVVVKGCSRAVANAPLLQVTTLALDQLSGLLGLNNPVPSPLADPVGFLTHPLITPILLGAITLNPAALALAMGGLAGNLVLTHMFTMAVSYSSPLSLIVSPSPTIHVILLGSYTCTTQSDGMLATTTAAVVAY